MLSDHMTLVTPILKTAPRYKVQVVPRTHRVFAYTSPEMKT